MFREDERADVPHAAAAVADELLDAIESGYLS
jgi:hypothetical protein